MNFRYATLASLSLLTLACQQYPEVSDYGRVCVSIDELDGQHRLIVNASSADCAGDHEGASFECSIAVDGQLAHVETVFQDGKDPNDACNGELETTCEIDVEPGSYVIEFGDEQYGLIVPGGEQVCFPGGGSQGTEG